MDGPPPGTDGDYDDGYNEMPQDTGPPPPPKKPKNMFGIFMMTRKIISLCTLLTLIGLEASIAVQDAQLKTLTEILKPKNSLLKRDSLHTGFSLAKRATPKIVCDYYSGFDVPAVKAGQARSVLYHFANCIALLGLVWLERPGTRGAAQTLDCSSFSIPPVGNVGLKTFGLLQIWIATSIINHYVGTFSYIVGFILIIAGIISILLGAIFIRKLKMISLKHNGGVLGGSPPMGEPMGQPGPAYDD